MVKATETYLERIVTDPTILTGKPSIKGTRISVELVLAYLAGNPNFDEFFADYPDLTMADVQACFAYAHQLMGQKRPKRTLDHSQGMRDDTAA
jgi:uncharacterized protein (DUF433 family)